jgi:hypothetical protein
LKFNLLTEPDSSCGDFTRLMETDNWGAPISEGFYIGFMQITEMTTEGPQGQVENSACFFYSIPEPPKPDNSKWKSILIDSVEVFTGAEFELEDSDVSSVDFKLLKISDDAEV